MRKTTEPPNENETSDQKAIGLYNKFSVRRTDGKDIEGEKHFGCEYLVLDLTHDPLAYYPVRAYAANAERAGYKKLSDDLYAKAENMRIRGVCPKIVNDAKERFDAQAEIQRNLILDAERYRYLRDEDKWGDDGEEHSFAALAESTQGDFDSIVDARMASHRQHTHEK